MTTGALPWMGHRHVVAGLLRDRWSPVVFLALVCAYVGGLGLAMDRTDYDTWGALVVGPILVALAAPVIRRTVARDGDPAMARLLTLALAAKLASAVARFFVAFEVYDGSADAGQYDAWGRALAPSYRVLDFSADIGKQLVGTGFARVLCGIVYAVTGPTKLGGFLVYAWLGFWGLFLFWRAFCIAVPDGAHRRYALLVFFVPTLLYWPSSIGKDAWMVLCIGLGAYGVARLLSGRRLGWPLAALGLSGTMLVRPHIGLLFAIGLVLAFLLRRSRRPSPTTPVLKGAGLVVLAVASVVVFSQTSDYFDFDKHGTTSGQEVFAEVERRTEQGGSSYDARVPTSPSDYPYAAFSVLFRPLPHEANNLQMFLTSLEGAALLVLCVASRRRLAGVLTHMVRAPYVAFCVAYTAAFLFAFSSIGNFGILARQRSQVLPLFLVLLAVPQREPRGARARAFLAAAPPVTR